jgi:hypothetical protein
MDSLPVMEDAPTAKRTFHIELPAAVDHGPAGEPGRIRNSDRNAGKNVIKEWLCGSRATFSIRQNAIPELSIGNILGS